MLHTVRNHSHEPSTVTELLSHVRRHQLSPRDRARWLGRDDPGRAVPVLGMFGGLYRPGSMARRSPRGRSAAKPDLGFADRPRPSWPARARRPPTKSARIATGAGFSDLWALPARPARASRRRSKALPHRQIAADLHRCDQQARDGASPLNPARSGALLCPAISTAISATVPATTSCPPAVPVPPPPPAPSLAWPSRGRPWTCRPRPRPARSGLWARR